MNKQRKHSRAAVSVDTRPNPTGKGALMPDINSVREYNCSYGPACVSYV